MVETMTPVALLSDPVEPALPVFAPDDADPEPLLVPAVSPPDVPLGVESWVVAQLEAMEKTKIPTMDHKGRTWRRMDCSLSVSHEVPRDSADAFLSNIYGHAISSSEMYATYECPLISAA
jgi:hypothetical protein